jgi:hypothetical protein
LYLVLRELLPHPRRADDSSARGYQGPLYRERDNKPSKLKHQQNGPINCRVGFMIGDRFQIKRRLYPSENP